MTDEDRDEGGPGVRDPLGLVLEILAPVVAFAAIVAGGLTVWASDRLAARSFGWFAYAPLSADVLVPSGAPVAATGVTLVGLGLVLLAFWAGRRAGRVSPARGRIGARGIAGRVAALIAVGVGAVLVSWQHTHVLLGWHDYGTATFGTSVVATEGQFEDAMHLGLLGPLSVGVTLVVLGLVSLAFVGGRRTVRAAAA